MTALVIVGVTCGGFGLLFYNLLHHSPPASGGPQQPGFGPGRPPNIPRPPFQP
jgi:hypothetical protein